MPSNGVENYKVGFSVTLKNGHYNAVGLIINYICAICADTSFKSWYGFMILVNR